MLKLVLFGAGGGGELFLSVIEKYPRRFRVVAFCDNDPVKQGEVMSGLPVVAPADLPGMDFDHLLITSALDFELDIYAQLVDLGVPAGKILCGSFLRMNAIDTRMAAFKALSSSPEVCVTGLSYFHVGVLPDRFSRPAFNFSHPSQDIFFDRMIAADVLSQRPSPAPGAWIIGLAYYSFHYDMSLSRRWPGVFHYGHRYGFHNLSAQRRRECAYAGQRKIFRDDVFDGALRSAFHGEQYRRDVLSRRASLADSGRVVRDVQAGVDFRKFYPSTVEENISLLDAMLRDLSKRGVAAIVALPPVHGTYMDNVPVEKRDEFFEIVRGLRARHSFLFLDAGRWNDFEDADFADPSHLNARGAAKFTARLDLAVEEAIARHDS